MSPNNDSSCSNLGRTCRFGRIATITLIVATGIGHQAAPAGAQQRPAAGPASQEPAGGVPSSAELPDTPAAGTLKEMVRVINSGDIEQMKKFVGERYASFWFEGGQTVDMLAAGLHRKFKETGGGLVVVDFKSVSPVLIAAKVRSATGAHYSISLNTTEARPDQIGMLMIAPAGSDANRGPAASDEEFVKQLDRYLDELDQHDQFSGTILVTRDGTTIYSRAVGEVSKSYGVANRLETKFSLASLNKMFTAVAVAQLAEKGKLSFEDTVGKHLPDYPNADVRDRVTIHHLLSHTSGIGGNIHTPESLRTSPHSNRTVKDRMRFFVNEPIDFSPGERMQYSNAGFQVLGRIIEVASGMDYYDYLQKHILQPTGMADTGCYDPDEVVHDRAMGYTSNRFGMAVYFDQSLSESGDGRLYETQPPARGGPAGGCYSTVVDLDRFMSAFTSGRLVSSEMVREMTSGKAVMAGNPDGPTEYGYGFMIVTPPRGRRFFGHGGTYWGVSTELRHYPKEAITVGILSNYDMAARNVAAKIDALLP